MKKIGRLTVFTKGWVPNMQDAYDTDLEWGSHDMNNYMSEEFAKNYPTIMEMALLIEKQRDEFKRRLDRMRQPKKGKHEKK